MEPKLDPQITPRPLAINEDIKSLLKETGKWAYFLSIIGFIGLGFFIILALFAGTIITLLGSTFADLGVIPTGIFSFMYLAFALVYFFPLYYLYNFGKKIRNAIETNDQLTLNESLSSLKSHYKFIGILTLITVITYTVTFLIPLVGGILSYLLVQP